MALFKSLFGKKKNEESDGQEEYFKEDFAPIVKQPASKKVEQKSGSKTAEPKKSTEPEKKPTAAKKTGSKPAAKDEKPAVTKKIAAKDFSNAEKPTEEKKPAARTAKKATESKTATKPASKNSAKGSKQSAKAQELSDDSPEVKGAVAIQESKPTANGKFDIRRAKDGRYFFSLYASNHTVIAYSQIYSSTTAVTTGINSVITNAPKCDIEDTTLKKPISLPCPKWEIYLDKAGEYRFRLYAPNGLCICHAAHGYASKSGCKGGIESIKRFSVESKVNKSY